MGEDQLLFMVSQKDPDLEVITHDDLYRVGTIARVKQVLKISEDDVVMALETLKPTESLNAVINEEDKNPVYLIDKIADTVNSESKEFEKLVLKDLISGLAPREKQIIAMRYFKGATQMKVANMLGISQVQVSRMEKKILENMRSKMAE